MVSAIKRPLGGQHECGVEHPTWSQLLRSPWGKAKFHNSLLSLKKRSSEMRKVFKSYLDLGGLFRKVVRIKVEVRDCHISFRGLKVVTIAER